MLADVMPLEWAVAFSVVLLMNGRLATNIIGDLLRD